MWIMTQNGAMVNLNHCSTVYVGTTGKTVMCYNDTTPSESKSQLQLGDYDTRDQCYDVIRMIFMAMDESETFTMPSRDEMHRTYQHRSHIQTSVSHGRS